MDCEFEGVQRQRMMDTGGTGYPAASITRGGSDQVHHHQHDDATAGVGDTLNSDVYRQKLRSAFINQQNSFNATRHHQHASNVLNGSGFQSSRFARGVEAPRSLLQPQRGGFEAGRWQPPPSDTDLVQSSFPTVRREPHRQRFNTAGQSDRVSVSRRPIADRSGLNRSNSSLELDRYSGECVLDDGVVTPAGGVGDYYGSVNSLDAVDSSFQAFVKTFRKDIERLDVSTGSATSDSRPTRITNPLVMSSSRSMDDGYVALSSVVTSTETPNLTNVAADGHKPSPPRIDDDTTLKESSSSAVRNHLHEPSETGDQLTSSTNLKTQKTPKSKDRKVRVESGVVETSGGLAGSASIFRKLRGVRSDPSASGNKSDLTAVAHGNATLEECQRRKAFTHYDCQSISVSLPNVIRRRVAANSSGDECVGGLKRTNTSTGASAASLGEKDTINNSGLESTVQVEDSISSAALGDGKSNALVESCLNFKIELGNEEEKTVCIGKKSVIGSGGQTTQKRTANDGVDELINSPLCNGVAVLDSSPNPCGFVEAPTITSNDFIFEHIDQGAYYYRRFFNDYDHQNYFGRDENLGPVAVSIKRERLVDADRGGGNSTSPVNKSDSSWNYLYRIIVRTSELTTLRGSILEDCIPATSKLTSARGLSPKDILEYVAPSLNVSCLRHAAVGPKIHDQLMKLDEQRMSKTYKIGILLCGGNQSTEEEMYNNENASPVFNEFLDFIGQRVRLKGFDKYRAGLDCKTDSTGIESIYSQIGGYEIMFHVSTLLPFTPNNKQQLHRKRHIGNDIVTIIFQEPGALPFTPKSIRSQFQHVFIIVRAHCSKTEPTKYSVAVTRLNSVPHFGPPFAKNALFEKSDTFREFLLVKAINAENAVHRSCKFTEMAMRTRQAYLADLASNFVSSSVDSGSRLGKFSLGSGRKKDKSKLRTVPDVSSKGAIVWNVAVEDASSNCNIQCFFAIATDVIVVVDAQKEDVIFAVHCTSVLGWTSFHENALRIYFNQGECINLYTSRLYECDEVKEIMSRLSAVTTGCQTEEVTLQRNATGQLGFHVSQGGIVTNVEPNGFAAIAGLHPNSRLVRICDKFVSTMSHEQVVELLRTTKGVVVTFLPPLDDGSVRKAAEDLNSVRLQWLIANNQSMLSATLDLTSVASSASAHALPLSHNSPISPVSVGKELPSNRHGLSASYLNQLSNESRPFHSSTDSSRPPPLDIVTSQSEPQLEMDNCSTGGSNGNAKWNFYPAYGRPSTKNSHQSTYRSDSMKLNLASGNSSSSLISRMYSAPGRTSLGVESGQPKTLFITDDPAMVRLNHHHRSKSGNWQNGGSDRGASPDIGTLRYREESKYGRDLNSNAFDARQSSRSRLTEQPRDDAAAGQSQGMLLSSPVNNGSASNRRSSVNQHHRSHHDLLVEPDKTSHLNTLDLDYKVLLVHLEVEYTDLAKKRHKPFPYQRKLSENNAHLRTHPSHLPHLPTSSSNTFEEDLMKLINVDVSVGELHRTLSDKSERRMSSTTDGHLYLGSTGQLYTTDRGGLHKKGSSEFNDRREQRLTRQTTIGIPGTNYRLRANPSALSFNNLPSLQNVPLPDSSAETMDWNSLVAVANRVLEGDGITSIGHHNGNLAKMDRVMSSGRESSRDLNSGITNLEVNSSEGSRSLEARVLELERMLDRESKEREFLESEVHSLRKQNARLQEESYAAAAQLRRFSGWFFNTIDKR